ncbi:MAG: methyltransferase domain-containing protein [Candidatus Daviesbacteria bacterium]|nr:methyltransferase domain-containing protein [Candidatus Daviesbacteria bacterium]
MKTLLEIHEDVPADHYDQGIRKNLFQKYWHWRRFKEVLRILEPVSGPVLDVGCHSGTFTKQLLTKLKTNNIYGIDISSSAINLAQKRLPQGHFQVASVEKLPFKDDFFEAVFCLEVLEHIDDPITALQEVKRVLTKEGKCYILIPSDNKLFKIIWLIWTLYYPHWRHAHVQSYSHGVLEKLLNNIGFKILEVKTFNSGMLKLIVCQK